MFDHVQIHIMTVFLRSETNISLPLV